MAETYISNLSPMSSTTSVLTGLPSRPIEGQFGLLLYESRTSSGRKRTFARLCSIEREDKAEQRAILVLVRLKLRRSLLSSQCSISKVGQERNQVRYQGQIQRGNARLRRVQHVCPGCS